MKKDIEANAWLKQMYKKDRDEVIKRCKDLGITELDIELLGRVVRDLGL